MHGQMAGRGNAGFGPDQIGRVTRTGQPPENSAQFNIRVSELPDENRALPM